MSAEQRIIIDYPEIQINGEISPAVRIHYSYPVNHFDAIFGAEVIWKDIGLFLGRIWRDFNHVDGTEPIQDVEFEGVRDSLVGDVYTICESAMFPNARYFIVAGIGFIEITAKGKEIWLATPYQR